MNIKQVERIAKAYAEIEKHHADILLLEKITEKILQKERGSRIRISFEDEKEEIKESIVQYPDYLVGMMFGFTDFGKGKEKEDENTISFSSEMSDLLSLEVIGVLIRKKQEAIEAKLKSIRHEYI